MALEDEIMNAIGAHGQWKVRLKTAIDTGKSEFQVITVRQDNQCPFGEWLYTVDAGVKASPDYEKVRGLHAAFHREAANVLDLALKGNKTEGEKSIAASGAFTKASSELTSALMSWRTAVRS